MSCFLLYIDLRRIPSCSVEPVERPLLFYTINLSYARTPRRSAMHSPPQSRQPWQHPPPVTCLAVLRPPQGCPFPKFETISSHGISETLRITPRLLSPSPVLSHLLLALLLRWILIRRVPVIPRIYVTESARITQVKKVPYVRYYHLQRNRPWSTSIRFLPLR